MTKAVKDAMARVRATALTPSRPALPFGEWLLAQQRRPGWIGDLARAAAADPGFPRLGMPADVIRRVRALAADGDTAQAVDAAADEWFGGKGWALPPEPQAD